MSACRPPATLEPCRGGHHTGQVLHQPVEVFRSARRRACDERAFMLQAVGIGSAVDWDGTDYLIFVESAVRAHALHHLWQYEQERRVKPRPLPSLPVQPHPWRGSVVYALLLLMMPGIVAGGWAPVDPYRVGVLAPAQVLAGEWWRVVTALTLHWDAAHLMGNLGSGVLLGGAAAQIWGNARAWLLILVAAMLANVTEALIGMPNYVSAGASTAVFAALGLIAGHVWRVRAVPDQSAMKRWIPLIAGVALLGLFGAGDPEADQLSPTNVLSHALGFAAGLGLGVLVATRRGASLLGRVPKVLAAVLALAIPTLAWTLALFAS